MWKLKCVSYLLRYADAKDLVRTLEKQAAKVHAEAEEAGNKALKIYANLTSLPSIDTKTLEVLISERFIILAEFTQSAWMHLKSNLLNF